MNIGVGILAGGKSSRMGFDKSQLIYKDETFLNNLIEEFKEYKTIVSINREINLSNKNIVLVEDKYKDIGPIGGILEILKASEHKYNFIVAVDMQNINSDIMKYIYKYISNDYSIYSVETSRGKNPLGAIYSKEIIPELENRISNGNYRLMDLLKEKFSKSIDLNYTTFEENIFQNINDRKDYSKFTKNNIISICGRKNSGKTTFICKLILELKDRGYTVGVIKHDGHDFSLENNTDTGKYYNSGANSTGIFSDSKYMIIENEKTDISKLIDKFIDMDLIIIEGLKNSNFNKFEVIRRANSQEKISKKPLKGIITDIKGFKDESNKFFDLDDVEIFTDYIVENYINTLS